MSDKKYEAKLRKIIDEGNPRYVTQVDVKWGFLDTLHSMTPPKTLIWETHSMTPPQGCIKEISQVALIDPTPRNSLKQSLIPSSLLKKRKIKK